MVLQLLVLACLASIYYQDLKYRAVYWFCFPILAVLLFVLKSRYTDIKILLFDSLIGLTFIGTQLVLVWLYFSIKQGNLYINPLLQERGIKTLGENAFALFAGGLTTIEEIYPLLFTN